MNPKSEFKNRSCGQFKNLLAVRAGVLLLGLAAASSPAQTYKILHSFTSSDGANPQGDLVLSGTTLYGTTCTGGNSNCGTVFRVSTDGTDYTVLKHFSGSDGANPWVGLALSGTTLYGATRYGGSAYTGQNSSYGVLFKLNTDGSGFTVLKQFTGNDGAYPLGLLLVSGNTIYGTAESGSGSCRYGAVFKVNLNGSGYTLLHQFPGGNALYPSAGLALGGATLFGTTSDSYAGSGGDGTVFRIATDGSGYNVLHLMAYGNDGIAPYAGLVLSGTTLYGTAAYGGNSQYGTLFKINTDGGGFTVLKQFAGSDGGVPSARLVLSGTTLYGTTRFGGVGYTNVFYTGCGTVFKIETNGSQYVVLKYFTGSDGLEPCAGLAFDGMTLYGTTSAGGSFNYGVVFALGYPPTIPPPNTQTAEAGATVDFLAGDSDDPSLKCRWFFNGNVIAGCTDPVLCLSSVQATNVGTYSVIVTNIFGVVTSAPIALNVIPPVERRPVPGINLMGDAGSVLYLDCADSLCPAPNWSTLDSVILTSGSQIYFDLTKPLSPQRFYRAWQTGTPSVAPSLTLPGMVPAITLTGNIGDQLRVDCINQFGPTDAWVTLDTVTLTNTSQLYFDVSAISQPPRLWRIVPVP